MFMWVSGNWRERQRWLWGFVSTLILLVGASEYLLSGWIFRFYGATRSYTRYIGGTSFLDLLLTSRWGATGRVLILLIVLWVCWQARRLAPETLAARRALSLVLAAAVCIAPNRGTYNEVLLLPGLLFIFWHGNERPESGIFVRQLKGIAWGLVIWPWLACAFLIVASGVFHAEDFVQAAWQLPLYTTLSLPLVLLVVLLATPTAPVTSRRTSPRTEILA
jgi:hypothetical protein